MRCENIPDKQTLLHQLQLTWQDHIQTRNQTWKTLEIEAALVLGLIGADLKFNNTWVTIIIGIVLIVASLSGIAITVHHRRGQIRKFIHMIRIEKTLGLHRPGLLDDVHPPREFKWSDLINPNPKRINTPLFILRMHIAMLAFTIIYIVARFLIGESKYA